KLVESWGVDYDIAIDCLPPLLTSILITAKYLNGVLRTHKLAPLCHIIRRDFERLKDLPEFEVFYFYTMQGRKIVVSLLGFFSILTVGYLALPTALMVHDILTKNKSEERYLMYQVDYGFMDPQDYYYVTAVHSYIGSLMIILIVSTMDSMFLTFVHHGCAIFAVTG
ncbi:uncharacterized protein LOC143374153, partial [Andrena cerasifolii]|uniref:uncharacterized protein LOC143374153 n=1 Tax=Andrena cerasifolii TaxID=2819439 RepID=UPI004037DDAC